MNYFWGTKLYSLYEIIANLYCTWKVKTYKLSVIFENVEIFYVVASYFYLWRKIFAPKLWVNYHDKSNYKLHVNSQFKFKFLSYSIIFNTTLLALTNNYLIFVFITSLWNPLSLFLQSFLKLNTISVFFWVRLSQHICATVGEGYIYIRGLLVLLLIDAALTDDEPLWEPIEWSLVQTWIFFIFLFAWVAENLITSRYGSYTGRDKRVWFAWFKTFWLLEMWYFLSYATASVFVIVPFYYELTYSISFLFSWWNWYTRVFFFKFISLYSLLLLLAFVFQINIRWLNWKKLIFFVLLINFFIGYLLYTHFIMSFFGYFTDPLWYQKTRLIDYIQLSQEPLKWGWGPAKRDHFTYHRVSTVFWFKNDSPFAGSFLMLHLFFFISIFFLYIYWLTLLRRVYSTHEFTYTFSTYCVSALKQFLFFFMLLYGFVFLSFVVNYWRFPIEFLWVINTNSWTFHLFFIFRDYFFFLLTILVKFFVIY